MKTLFTKLLSASLIILTLSGCMGDPVKFENTVTDRSAVDTTRGRKISARAMGFQLLLLLPIMTNSRQERAYQDLLAQAGDDLISDVFIQEAWYYAYIGTIHATYLSATAYPRIK